MEFNNKQQQAPKDIAELKQITRPNGLHRPIQYTLDNDASFNNAIKHFISIAERMVGKPYNAKPLKEPIIKIVDWLFQSGRTNIDYSKGLLLKGAVGRGKNVLLEALAVMIDELKFKQVRTKDGVQSIVTLTPNIRESSHLAMDFTNDAGGIKALQVQGMYPSLVIHDLGKEDYRSNYYGNSLNVVEYMVDLRESNRLLTFATTNFNSLGCDPNGGGKSAEYAGYDDRTISRMHSLFNVIALDHDIDFRKQ